MKVCIELSEADAKILISRSMSHAINAALAGCIAELEQHSAVISRVLTYATEAARYTYLERERDELDRT